MGNWVGTIHFDRGTINVDDLDGLRKMHKLDSADPNYLAFDPTKESYGVAINGMQVVAWSMYPGGAESAIKNFLADAQKMYGDRIKTDCRHLPV